MTRLIASVLFAVMLIFAGTASAAELSRKCTYQPAQPAGATIEAVRAEYPDITETQVVDIARIVDLAEIQLMLANDKTATKEMRGFADRTVQIAMELAAVRLAAFDAVPQMEAVRAKMEAEKTAGLKEVSPDLLPEIRRTAVAMIVIGQTWVELGNELMRLSADRFIAAASESDGVPSPQVLEKLDHAVCALEAVVTLDSKVVDYFATAVALAYVEHVMY